MIKNKKQIIQTVLESLKRGSGIQNACKNANIDPATFWRWRRKNKSLDRKVWDIIDSRTQMVEDALWRKALEGDVTAQIFILTNRAHDRWQDRRALVKNIINNKVGANAGNNGKPDKEFQERMLKRLGDILQE